MILEVVGVTSTQLLNALHATQQREGRAAEGMKPLRQYTRSRQFTSAERRRHVLVNWLSLTLEVLSAHSYDFTQQCRG